jgi:hypothetical protein
MNVLGGPVFPPRAGIGILHANGRSSHLTLKNRFEFSGKVEFRVKGGTAGGRGARVLTDPESPTPSRMMKRGSVAAVRRSFQPPVALPVAYLPPAGDFLLKRQIQQVLKSFALPVFEIGPPGTGH